MTPIEPSRVSPEALAALAAARETIIRTVLERTHEVAHHGDEAERILSAGLEFTTRMLETAMQLHQPGLLDQQIDWAYERLPHDSTVPEHILSRFQIYAEVVGALLPAPHAEAVNQFVNRMIVRQQALMQKSRAQS